MKLDLVQILLTEYPDRIQPSIPSEVQDIADAHGVTAYAVCRAMDQALDELECLNATVKSGIAIAVLNGAFPLERCPHCSRKQFHELECPNSNITKGIK